jgi:hypothetical protein
MTPETISATAGVLLSLLFSYAPGVSAWYADLDGAGKRLVMLAALLLTAGGLLALSCLGVGQVFGAPLPACDRAGLQGLLEGLVIALVANQSTYLISPRKNVNGANEAPLA